MATYPSLDAISIFNSGKIKPALVETSFKINLITLLTLTIPTGKKIFTVRQNPQYSTKSHEIPDTHLSSQNIFASSTTPEHKILSMAKTTPNNTNKTAQSS